VTSATGFTVVGTTKSITRQVLANELASHYNIVAPIIADGTGSTLPSEFLSRIVRRMGGNPGSLHYAYRWIEFALAKVGEAYDDRLDSSEHKGRTGGGTITNHAYRKLLRGATGVPFCFIVDTSATRARTDVRGQSYAVGGLVGRRSLLEASAGSRVVLINREPGMTGGFFGHAWVESITSEEAPSRIMRLRDFEEFPVRIPLASVHISGWNRQHGVAEIDLATLTALVAAGGLSLEGVDADTESQESAAAAALESLGDPRAPVDLAGRSISMDRLSQPASDPSPQFETPLDDSLHERDHAFTSARRAGSSQRALDKYAEIRAVQIVQTALGMEGWSLVRDCQSLGVGYDLEYEKGGRLLLVEVKGIQGSSLAFNMTAKEWAVAVAVPSFVVIAVTEVLDDALFVIHTVDRRRLFSARRRPVQFRLDRL
jgi:Domain of unknown function (DUF3883)